MRKKMKSVVILYIIFAILTPAVLPTKMTTSIAQAASEIRINAKTLSLEIGETPFICSPSMNMICRS